MGKPQYEQKFRTLWLNDPALKDWLIVVESTLGNRAKCKFCGVLLTNKYSALQQHTKSKKHIQFIKAVFPQEKQVQRKLSFKHESEAELTMQKEAEARLALYVCCHTSINACDHLNNICKKSFKGHTCADNLQIHRTKCFNVIQNVLSRHFIESLCVDIGDSPYSLLIDESTDISVFKYLGIVIIYFSKKLHRIVETFLDMPQIKECNAVSIAEVVKSSIKKFNLKLENLKGLGTDNASVMVGVNNGVFAKLKEEVPGLILVR